MRSKYKCIHICLIIFDICCVVFILFCGSRIMLQKEEMEILRYPEDNSYANSISDLQDAVDKLEWCNLKSAELENEYEEIKSKCDVRIYLESVDLEMNKSAYIEKLFSISKNEPQIKNDWIQIIYKEENDQPIGILVQNQMSGIGIDGVKLGMSAKEIMDIFPDATEESILYDGETVKYILLEDENYRYYYVKTGGFGETTKLYIEKR